MPFIIEIWGIKMMTFVLMPQIFCNSEVKLTQSTKLLEISLGEKKEKKKTILIWFLSLEVQWNNVLDLSHMQKEESSSISF